MIKNIKLNNFRSHSNTEINLSPHINIICGDNDLGKSSILRALNFVAFNKPSGESFIKHKKKGCSVSIELDDFKVVRKKVKKGENTYIILKDGNEYNKFSAFGQSVPEEIQNILKIDDINIQNQQDKTFLLSETSSYISKYLNNIVGLDIIDKTLSNANSEIRGLNSDIKREELRLQELEKEKESLSDLNNYEKKYKKIIENQKEYDKIDENIKNLSDCIGKIKFFELEIEKFDSSNVDYCLEINNNFLKLSNIIAAELSLSNLINSLKLLKEDKINYKEEKDKHKNIIKELSEYNNIIVTEVELRKVINNILTIEENISSLDLQIKTNQKKFLAKFPKQCPLCGYQKEKK